MLATLTTLGLLLIAQADVPEEPLKSDYYRVIWKAPAEIDRQAVLEIGDGSGHGQSLRWLRFRPTQDSVEVLSIVFQGKREQYRSKWPPDVAPVTITVASLKPTEYASLLQQLAKVNAAVLKPKKKIGSYGSSNSFWVHARLSTDQKTFVDQEWAGYQAGHNEIHYGKPETMNQMARKAIRELEFKPHTMTAEDQAWASAKFLRDQKQFLDAESHWWVRDRYIITIGVIGDDSVLPSLKEIIQGDTKDNRAYFGINAITRLTKQDVRDSPIEEMDVEKTRDKVIQMLKQRE